MQTVYIDVLFFVNLFQDMMIFLSASVILRRNERWWRYLIASVIGALYSCFAFFTPVNIILVYTGALIFYALCALFVFGVRTPKAFMKFTVVTLITAFCYGGIFFLLYLFTGFGSISVFNNGTLYIDLPIAAVLGFSGFAFLALWVFSKVSRYLHPENCRVKITLELFGNRAKLIGLIDSGNLVSDTLSGNPVMICSFDAVRKLLPNEIRVFLKNDNVSYLEGEYAKSIRLIPVSTVNGTGIMKAVRGGGILIEHKKHTYSVENVLVAFSEDNYGMEDIQALLPADILEFGERRNETSDSENNYKVMRITGQ